MEVEVTNSEESFSKDESFQDFQRQKDKLYHLALETHFLTRQLKAYTNRYNKVDKNFATLLLDAVDAIDDFLKNAEVVDDDENYNVFDIVPAIESGVCEAHRSYRCRPCQLNVRTSAKCFKEHFYGAKHVKNLRVYEKSLPDKKDDAQSLTDSVAELSLKAKKKIAAADMDLPKKMKQFMETSDLETYTAQLLAQGHRILTSNLHARVCDLLQQQLRYRFPEVKVYPFGSMVIGLGKIKGDLDIFVDIGNCYFQKPSKRIMKNAIHRTQEILRNCGSNWSDFEPVIHARTPILRAFCRAVGIDCDLSFSNGLSACNTRLIGYFVNLQPVCKKLVIFLKHWQASLQLGLNSYIISILVIFYLQQQKLLPPVEILQRNQAPVFIDGWRCNFEAIDLARLRIPLVTDFSLHLLGFFQYYGYEFDYKKDVVSILTGCPVDKKMFDHGQEENLPPVFERFKLYMKTVDLNEADEVEDLFSNNKPFVIQDPYELCHNVAKGVQENKLQKIINLTRRAHEILVARKK